VVVSVVDSSVVGIVVDSSVVVSVVASTVEGFVVVSSTALVVASAVVLASTVVVLISDVGRASVVEVSSSTVEDSGSIVYVLEIISARVVDSDVKSKVLKGMKEDSEVSGGGWKEDETFDHLKVLDGIGSVMAFFVVTTPFGCVVTIGGWLFVGRVETPGGTSSEEEGTEMIDSRDGADVNCWTSLVVASLVVTSPS
jgi:hypothetical protein